MRNLVYDVQLNYKNIKLQQIQNGYLNQNKMSLRFDQKLDYFEKQLSKFYASCAQIPSVRMLAFLNGKLTSEVKIDYQKELQIKYLNYSEICMINLYGQKFDEIQNIFCCMLKKTYPQLCVQIIF